MIQNNHTHRLLYPCSDGLLYAEIPQHPGQKPSCPVCDFFALLEKIRLEQAEQREQVK